VITAAAVEVTAAELSTAFTQSGITGSAVAIVADIVPLFIVIVLILGVVLIIVRRKRRQRRLQAVSKEEQWFVFSFIILPQMYCLLRSCRTLV